MRQQTSTPSLAAVPGHYAHFSKASSPFLSTVLRHIPQNGTACEVACGSGYASIWLSQRSVRAEAIDESAAEIERSRQVNDILGGNATFLSQGYFKFYDDETGRHAVVHHQGMLHRYAVPWIHALLAQQVASAEKVVFSVPSVFHAGGMHRDERLLPIEEWERILRPFQVLDLHYYGVAGVGGREHILCVLEGQPLDDALLQMMTVPAEPYPQGISAIVHTRNEARNIEQCIQTLQGWTDEIIVCDMESSDATLEIASRFTDNIVHHPRLINFDRARNVSAMRTKYRWVFYLDADERVPEAMGAEIRARVLAEDASFSALATPYRTIFAGRWLQSLYPGYKAPPLYRNGKFVYNAAVHAGALVDGPVEYFPANNPENSILHHSYADLDHFLEKLKGYSAAEAINLDAAGAQFAWQNAVRDFTREFYLFYNHLDGGRDGVHGFLWSFLGGMYRFMQHAKLYERHFRAGKLQPGENEVPASLEEVLEYALHVARQAPKRTPPLVKETPVAKETPAQAVASGIRASTGPISVRWEGTQFVWHSLAHVNREFCLSLMQRSGIDLSLVPYEADQFAPATEHRFGPLEGLQFAPLAKPAAVHVRHQYPPRLTRPPEGHLVLMQPWEYGYLPKSWIAAIHENVSEVWCNSNYEKNVFTASGVPEERIQLVPLGVNLDVYNPDAPPHVFTTEPGSTRLAALAPPAHEPNESVPNSGGGPFVFLFVGGTLYRKGIDILLQAYQDAFTEEDNVCLVIKDSGTNTIYRGQNEREKILCLIGDENRPDIVYLDADLSSQQVAGLYTACDCLVQPYRGEGFCLPVLEAMGCGRAVITTAGGPTDDFVDESVGWRIPSQKRLLDHTPLQGEEFVAPPWWFEPDTPALVELLRHAYQNRDEVKQRGAAGHRRVVESWSWEQAADKAVERIQALAATPVVEKSNEALTVNTQESSSSLLPRAPKISLCMIVRNEERVLGACLDSIAKWVDEIIIVDTGSTDRTVEIAEKAGARVFHHPWDDSFSQARNESLSHATGDWVFWIDADDTVPEECASRLRDLALTAADDLTGFLIKVRIPPSPGESGCVEVDHIKLFRNLPGLRFEGRIHEQILESIYRQGGRIERSDLYVNHSGYDYSPEGQEGKRKRDWALLEKDLEERPGHPFVLFNIGMTAYHLKDFRRSITALEECLRVSKPHESTIRKVYAMLAGCYLEKGDRDRARSYIRDGLTLFPHDPELLFRSGIIAQACGDLGVAETAYLQLLQAPDDGHIDSIDVSIKGFKAHHNLGLVYRDMGRSQEAEAHWLAALREQPQFVPSQLALGESYLEKRQFHKVCNMVQKLQRCSPAAAEAMNDRLQRVRAQPM